MALVIVILALLSTLAFFYLKCSMMQSLMTLWSACFILLFVVVFASLRALSEFVMIGPVDLGNAVKLPVSLLCGLLAGIIISGNLLVALGLLPMHGKIFYSRFSPDSPVALNSPQKPALSTDGFVAGLYRLISSGSLRSSKSFGVLHADYLSQVHLNKLKTKDEILSICAQEALIMPTGKIKKPVRLITVDDKELTVIRVGVKSKKVDDGGASNASGVLQFFPGQLRLIVKEANAATEPMAGTATAKYPVGLWEGGKVTEWELDQIIAPDSTQIENRVYWMDVAFQCSNGETPILLEFRQNAVIELPKAVESTPEIEGELNNDGEKDASL
ncbi:MAG: hypothetical protein ACYSOV_02395 [Planctomycetota bacterium]|jgi:hypothetical protein